MRVNVIANSANAHLKRVESVVSLVNGCQHYYRLELLSDQRFGKTGGIASAELLAREVVEACADRPAILVIEDAFDDNWFSHEYRSASVITTSDWESTYAPPSLKAYVMYQIAQALIHFSADMSEEMAMNMVHEPPVGCIYDLALLKPNIRLGMVAGSVCHRCVGQLRALGTPEMAIDAVIQIVSLVRAEALGRAIIFDPQEVFVAMRFSHNDENDNAWRHGIKPGIESCGFRAVRGDDHIESGQILEKVDKAIRRSRPVIAKVDENNLNVYYELGLAMGLAKDVLLVSENSLTLNLPSDLKNWECLTYEKGNYQQLATRVEEFLADQYQLGGTAV